jgi:hypothetical protein
MQIVNSIFDFVLQFDHYEEQCVPVVRLTSQMKLI